MKQIRKLYMGIEEEYYLYGMALLTVLIMWAIMVSSLPIDNPDFWPMVLFFMIFLTIEHVHIIILENRLDQVERRRR